MAASPTRSSSRTGSRRATIATPTSRPESSRSIGGSGTIVDPGFNTPRRHLSYQYMGFIPVGQDRWMLDHDDAYTWFIAADPAFEDLWIFTRDAHVDPALLEGHGPGKAKAIGYDPGQLKIPRPAAERPALKAGVRARDHAFHRCCAKSPCTYVTVRHRCPKRRHSQRHAAAPSSSGLGRCPFTAKTRVRVHRWGHHVFQQVAGVNAELEKIRMEIRHRSRWSAAAIAITFVRVDRGFVLTLCDRAGDATQHERDH